MTQHRDFPGFVTWWCNGLEHWTFNQVVMGSTPGSGCCHTPVPLSPSNIIWYWPRGSNALARKVIAGLHHIGHAPYTWWSTHLRAQWPREGDEHLAYALEGMPCFTFFCFTNRAGITLQLIYAKFLA